MVILWNYNDNYLAHYGVIGMKWGIRRAEKNKEKAARYKRYADDYDPKGYTVKLSDKERAKAKRKKDAALAKSKKYASRAKAIEQKHKDRTSSKTYNRVKNTSTAKLLGESMVFGTYGALKYNQARAQGSSRGKSILDGLLYGAADNLSGGIVDMVEPRVSASEKRERRKNQK